MGFPSVTRTRQKRRAAERVRAVDRSVTALARKTASAAPSLAQRYGQSASGKQPPLACAPLCSVFAPQPPPLHHCAARDETPSPAACASQADRAAGGGKCSARAKGCGVVACGGCCVAACNITASYAKRMRRANPARPQGSHKRPLCLAPFRVNTATRSTSITLR